ncbi:hypothetical protein COS81_04905 [candidate division WWE3 bacterium CG06_land_8_20_14_3_00_42_16]|uniref:HD domain-containing protein n=1 Tax=candidate division WWE3 bacterium CG06_land_8_20_14_3_00_42_16 TaxID=1975083 RepID=A0A2M7ALC7_UNCKA|nr:MAG: hypothetical protein COS81_04905 [candidate division WWE3 bacterium CG06_land_8_20_14_3_00_42_16]
MRVYNRRREPRVYPWVNPSKIFDEVARRFGGNLRFQSTTGLPVGIYNMCLHLAKDESEVDLDILKTSALLHDIARAKEDKDDSGNIDHAILGAEMAENILKDFGYSNDKIEAVKHCIITHRFRSGNEPKIKEAKILFDADKLDVIGSIGIARSFMIAGQYGEKMFIRIIKKLISPISGKRKFQKIFEALNQLSLIGMNIGGGSDPEDSGERSALDYINKHFKSLSKIILFDVGANVGHYSILLKEIFGEKAEIHVFEPSAKTFQKLQLNVGGTAL